MSQKPFRPVLRTQSDVEQMWRRLMSPLGFSSSSLWMVVIEDERPLPQITEFGDLPDWPADGNAAGLAGLLENVAAPQASCAFLRSRPGHGLPDARDRAWAQTLYDAGRLAEVRLEVIHLAHDHDVLPIAIDDLLVESA